MILPSPSQQNPGLPVPNDFAPNDFAIPIPYNHTSRASGNGRMIEGKTISDWGSRESVAD